MSHHTTPSHKRDTVICLLSTSPNCISLVDVQSTTKINPSPAAISKLPSTATTSKKKEPHPPKTKSQRRPNSSSTRSGKSSRQRSVHKPKPNSAYSPIVLTVSSPTRKGSTYLAGQHPKASPQAICSDLTSTVCNGQSRSKRAQHQRHANKHPSHYTQRTTKITLSYMEARTMKHMNYLATSTSIKSKPSTGFSATTCRTTLSNPEYCLEYASVTIKFTCSEGTISTHKIIRDTSMTFMKFNLT